MVGDVREGNGDAPPSSGISRSSILMVDDREDNLRLLEFILHELNCDLVRARSGREALGQLLNRDFAVILLDVRMPEMDGYETAELIRRRPRSTLTPIIFVTGNDANSDQIARAYAVGAVDLIFKPFSAEVLRAKVRTFLELFETSLRLKDEIRERERAQEERDRLGEELLQGQKLQAVGQLSAGIAHEINNPLGYLLSNMSVLEEYLEKLGQFIRVSLQEKNAGRARGARDSEPEYLLEDFKTALRESRQGAERIRDIVQSLKEFSHRDEKDLKAADLNRCVEDALRLCANELKHKAEVRQDLGKLPLVWCFPQQIEQVLVNLLVNAAQAIPEKGRIDISSRVEDERAVIRIRDSGSGIPPDQMKKLFEPFFTTKPVGKGTGLGLHVAYKIIKAHGGRIDVDSTPGVGSEFTLQVPVSGPVLKGT
jgi:signal transduction histidine kinase